MNPKVNIYYDGKLIMTVVLPRTETDVPAAVAKVKGKLQVSPVTDGGKWA